MSIAKAKLRDASFVSDPHNWGQVLFLKRFKKSIQPKVEQESSVSTTSATSPPHSQRDKDACVEPDSNCLEDRLSDEETLPPSSGHSSEVCSMIRDSSSAENWRGSLADSLDYNWKPLEVLPSTACSRKVESWSREKSLLSMVHLRGVPNSTSRATKLITMPSHHRQQLMKKSSSCRSQERKKTILLTSVKLPGPKTPKAEKQAPPSTPSKPRKSQDEKQAVKDKDSTKKVGDRLIAYTKC